MKINAAFALRKQIFLIIHMQAFDWLQALLPHPRTSHLQAYVGVERHNKSLLFALKNETKFHEKVAF